jgi:hypothetical protein
VVCIGNQGLRVEDVAANELSNGHAQVGDQANSGNSNASIAFVRGGQVGVVMMVVVVMVAVTAMSPSLCHGKGCTKNSRSGMKKKGGSVF